MNFLNLRIDVLSGEEFLGSEPVDRATWLCLMRYCAQHETGGRIKGAASWGARKWMILCGITKEEVLRKAPLWRWEEGDVVVSKYPAEQEKTMRNRRKEGKKWGRGHRKPKETSPLPETKVEETSPLPETKPKETSPFTTAERNGMEWNGKKLIPPLSPSETFPQGGVPATGMELRLVDCQPGESEAKSGVRGSQESSKVDAIYQAYPRHEGKGAAVRAIERAIKGGVPPETLLERTRCYAAAVALWPPEYRRTAEGRDTVPHPSTWYNQRRWEDDPASWLPPAPVRRETRIERATREARESLARERAGKEAKDAVG